MSKFFKLDSQYYTSKGGVFTSGFSHVVEMRRTKMRELEEEERDTLGIGGIGGFVDTVGST